MIMIIIALALLPMAIETVAAICAGLYECKEGIFFIIGIIFAYQILCELITSFGYILNTHPLSFLVLSVLGIFLLICYGMWTMKDEVEEIDINGETQNINIDELIKNNLES